MKPKIIQIPANKAESLCRKITADLPEYFGLPECNEHYAKGVRERVNFGLSISDNYVGLLCLDFPYSNNANIYWMGILKDHQTKGYGCQLIHDVCDYAKQQGSSTMTVETLSPNESDENYLKTYHFYQKMGFLPLFNLKPEGYTWQMVYMCKSLL